MSYLKTLAVSNLPCDVEETELDAHFSKAGAIETILLCRDNVTGFCNGKGYVIFEDSESVTDSLSNLGSVKLPNKNGDVLLVIKSASQNDESDIVRLMSKNTEETARDPLDILIDKLSSTDIDRLISKINAKRSANKIPEPSQIKFATTQKPRLPHFSGDPDGKEQPYHQWRYHVMCLINNPSYSDQEILESIRFSLKGTAAEINYCLESSLSPLEVLNQFDISFGDVHSKSLLREEFYSAKQEHDESLVAWSCRLQKMLHSVKEKGAISSDEAVESLKSRFWFGLKHEKLKEALRESHNRGDSFQSLLTLARGLELEYLGHGDSSTTKSTLHHKNVKPSNISHQQATDLADTVHQILQRMSGIESRITNMEKSMSKANGSQHGFPRVPSNSNGVNPQNIFCKRCKRKTHTEQDCVAKRDIHGNRLN